MNNNNKYPVSLFVIGFLMNLTKNFFLLIAGIIFAVMGIRVKWCLHVGVVLLLLNVAVSFVEQLQIRNAVIKSDNPNFKEWQESIMSPNWRENTRELLRSKINKFEDADDDNGNNDDNGKEND